MGPFLLVSGSASSLLVADAPRQPAMPEPPPARSGVVFHAQWHLLFTLNGTFALLQLR